MLAHFDWLAPPSRHSIYSILFIEIPVWHLILVWAAVSRRRSATVPQNQVQPGSVFASLQWNSILGRHRDLLGQYAGKESPTLAQVHQISRLVRKDLRHPQSIVSIVLNFCFFFLWTVAKSSRIWTLSLHSSWVWVTWPSVVWLRPGSVFHPRYFRLQPIHSLGICLTDFVDFSWGKCLPSLTVWLNHRAITGPTGLPWGNCSRPFYRSCLYSWKVRQ